MHVSLNGGSYNRVYCYTTDKLVGIVVQIRETKNWTLNKFVVSLATKTCTRLARLYHSSLALSAFCMRIDKRSFEIKLLLLLLLLWSDKVVSPQSESAVRCL